MANLHSFFPKLWYENHWSRILLFPILLPLSIIYCMLITVRRFYLTRRPGQTPLPVIVVGNITVGGTGKTPFVIYLIERLQAWGWSPGVVTRGYSGSESGPLLITGKESVAHIGDETKLLWQHLNCPLVMARQRNDGVSLLKKNQCNLVVSDDGLQHLKMQRQLEIVLLDKERKLGNGWCLPAGPLRERANRLQQTDLVLINGEAGSLGFEYEYSHFQSVNQQKQLSLQQARQAFSDYNIHAVAGIGNPGRFFQVLKNLGFLAQTHAFADHHSFKDEDLPWRQDIILMTEKDAMKCAHLSHENMWYLCMDIADNPLLDAKLQDLLKAKMG